MQPRPPMGPTDASSCLNGEALYSLKEIEATKEPTLQDEEPKNHTLERRQVPIVVSSLRAL